MPHGTKLMSDYRQGEQPVHEFSEGYVDPKLCYYCGGYPFAIQHWTI